MCLFPTRLPPLHLGLKLWITVLSRLNYKIPINSNGCKPGWYCGNLEANTLYWLQQSFGNSFFWGIRARKSLSNRALQNEELSKIIFYQFTYLLGTSVCISFHHSFHPPNFEVKSVIPILQMRLVELLRLARTWIFILLFLSLSPRCFHLNPLSFWAILDQFNFWPKCPISQINVFYETVKEAQCIPVASRVNNRKQRENLAAWGSGSLENTWNTLFLN